MLCKHCSAIMKTLVCNQHSFSHKSKTLHCTSYYEKNNYIPAKPRKNTADFNRLESIRISNYVCRRFLSTSLFWWQWQKSQYVHQTLPWLLKRILSFSYTKPCPHSKKCIKEIKTIPPLSSHSNIFPNEKYNILTLFTHFLWENRWNILRQNKIFSVIWKILELVIN